MAIPKDILNTAGVVAMDNLLKRAGVTTEEFEKTSQAIKPITQEDVIQGMEQAMPMLQQDPSQRSMNVMPSDPTRIAGVENVKRAFFGDQALGIVQPRKVDDELNLCIVKGRKDL